MPLKVAGKEVAWARVKLNSANRVCVSSV
ncbi:hypothetical protein SGPA1_50153 [Streptomyces misionensis JCM 4497]